MASAEEWMIDPDFHSDGYAETDRLVDSAGHLFRMTGGTGFDPGRRVSFEPTGDSRPFEEVRSDLEGWITIEFKQNDQANTLRRVRNAGTIAEAIRFSMIAGI